MMPELSLHVLDIANNAISANASLIEISIHVHRRDDLLTIRIADNGCGMSKEQISQVEDPFFTTRKTRKQGFGVPFFKLAALSSGGQFQLQSSSGCGTTVIATFRLSHIDRMPFGNIVETLHTLITLNTHIDFLYTYELDDRILNVDTKEFRKILGDIPFNTPEVSSFLKEYLTEKQYEVDQGFYL